MLIVLNPIWGSLKRINTGNLYTLLQAKKADLLSLAETLQIPLSSNALKSQILNLVLDYYVMEDILSEELVSDFRPQSSIIDKELELAKIHLELEETKKQNEEFLSKKRIAEREAILELEYQNKIREVQISRDLELKKAKISVQ